MTISLQRTSPLAGLMSDEDVLPQLQLWQRQNQRTTLVTLITVEGGAPRQPGAQMAVAADGRYCGYLSGGCLESAVVLEAQAVMAAGQNKLVRFGRGSPYFDIKLPCGSGLDLYFDQGVSAVNVSKVIAARQLRQTAWLRTELSSGISTVATRDHEHPIPHSGREGDSFTRIYPAHLRLLLLGNGPALLGAAAIAAAIGFELSVASRDEATRAGLVGAGIQGDDLANMPSSALEHLDFATAAILFFHAHDEEPELLRHLLKSKCFYIGALGNHAVHRQRLSALQAMGFSPSSLSRIRAPMGVIANAKSKATLAVSVLAELMSEAKALNLVA